MNSKSGCIVITGSSKGIGLGLAQDFLEQSFESIGNLWSLLRSEQSFK